MIGLAAIAVYSLVSIFLLPGVNRFNAGYLVNLLALLVLIYETYYAGKAFHILNSVLFVFSWIGFMFTIMHWPFGRIIFLLPLFIGAGGLLINAFRLTSDRALRCIILLFPLFHLITVTGMILHWSMRTTLIIFDFILMGCVAIAIFIKLFILKDRKPGEPGQAL